MTACGNILQITAWRGKQVGPEDADTSKPAPDNQPLIQQEDSPLTLHNRGVNPTQEKERKPVDDWQSVGSVAARLVAAAKARREAEDGR